MPKKWTHTAAFAHFGTKPKNTQWSWSARSLDGETVVATFWQDQFEKQDGRLVYRKPPFEKGYLDQRLGWTELMENLAWARDHCDGRFRVIIAIAKDREADPRSIKECFPSEMIMRLISLDTISGEYVAELAPA